MGFERKLFRCKMFRCKLPLSTNRHLVHPSAAIPLLLLSEEGVSNLTILLRYHSQIFTHSNNLTITSRLYLIIKGVISATIISRVTLNCYHSIGGAHRTTHRAHITDITIITWQSVPRRLQDILDKSWPCSSPSGEWGKVVGFVQSDRGRCTLLHMHLMQ